MRIDPTALRDARQRAGHSQASLGRVARVAQSHISHLERGAGREIRPTTAKRLADALGVDIDAITTRDDTRAAS